MQQLGCDATLLREIALLFLADCPHRLAELRTALAHHDPHALERAAHSLKGSLSNFVATGAVAAAIRVEHLGRSGDLTAAAEACAALEGEIALVKRALAELG
jgi:HPt (histidine-containing phosphotransfer) domain-containing protein